MVRRATSVDVGKLTTQAKSKSEGFRQDPRSGSWRRHLLRIMAGIGDKRNVWRDCKLQNMVVGELPTVWRPSPCQSSGRNGISEPRRTVACGRFSGHWSATIILTVRVASTVNVTIVRAC